MLITKTSIFSGITRTLDLDITEKQLYDWQAGMLIQKAMPNLSANDREFLISGVTEDEWNTVFGSEDE